MENYCIKCKQPITPDEFHFSYKYCGKGLCRKHQPTPEALRLGKKLEELGNWNIVYEAYDGHKSVDMRLPGPKVDIEVDGLQHSLTKEQALADLKRTYYSYKNDGFFTLHVPNILIRDNNTIDETAKFIDDFLEYNYSDVSDNIIVKFFKRLFSK